MRALPQFSMLLIAGALAGLGGCQSCKRSPSSNLTAVPDKPPADSGSEAGDADAPEAAAPEVPTSKILPDIACTTSPSLRWLDEPAAQFSCSDLRTPVPKGTSPASYVDASGAKVSPLEFTVSPSTELTVGVGVKNGKGLAFASAVVRYQLEGAPASAKVDAAAGKLRWKVNAPAGSTFLFEIAALTKLAEGERCVKQPIVVHVVDDDDTRAHQIANKLRMNAFFRTLDCQWAHQGFDIVESGNADAADEKSLRDALACGEAMVMVQMMDLNADGLKDALVAFREHMPSKPPSAPAHWETGPGVQIHLRKGDDFVFAGEGPGEMIEADDGTMVLLDTNHEEHSLCPPRPYKSTGYPGCDITHIEVRKLVGARFEWIGQHDGPVISDGGELGPCPVGNLKVQKDGKDRLTGFLDGTHVTPWNQKTPQTP